MRAINSAAEADIIASSRQRRIRPKANRAVITLCATGVDTAAVDIGSTGNADACLNGVNWYLLHCRM